MLTEAFESTRSMVRTLMLYGINSGALTRYATISIEALRTLSNNLPYVACVKLLVWWLYVDSFVSLFLSHSRLVHHHARQPHLYRSVLRSPQTCVCCFGCMFRMLRMTTLSVGLNALLATLNARLDLRRTCQHNLSTSGQSMKPLLSPSIRYSSKTEPGSPRNFSGRVRYLCNCGIPEADMISQYLSFQVQAETLPQLPRASRTAMHRVGYADADILEQGLWSPPTIFRSPRQSHFSDD